MSAGTRKLTDREMKASALNKKEDRVLQKTFGTLDLEMSFTYNVLSLHVRTIKANFKRLRDKVDKLKSNLTPEEITMLRKLEEEGKFKPANTFNVNAAMKISAAARRLSLYPEGIKRSRTSLSPRRRRASEKLLPSRPTTSASIMRKRSNSVVGVFIDAPTPDNTERRNSINSCQLTQPMIRPMSAAHVNLKDDVVLETCSKSTEDRPSTSTAMEREKTSMSKVSFKSGPNKTIPPPMNLDISVLDFQRNDSILDRGKSKSPRDKLGSMTVIDETLDTGRTKLFEDRRQELLQDEQIFSKGLDKRKKEFINEVDQYLKLNPPARFTKLPIPIVPRQAGDVTDGEEDEEEILKYTRGRRQLRQYDMDDSRTYTTEEDYRRREGELWKDLNKTRYLRVPDDKLDLSGVVTLAKDQMKLFKLLHCTEPAHIITH